MKFWTNHSYLLRCYVPVTLLKALLVLSKRDHHPHVVDGEILPIHQEVMLGPCLSVFWALPSPDWAHTSSGEPFHIAHHSGWGGDMSLLKDNSHRQMCLDRSGWKLLWCTWINRLCGMSDSRSITAYTHAPTALSWPSSDAHTQIPGPAGDLFEETTVTLGLIGRPLLSSPLSSPQGFVFFFLGLGLANLASNFL